MVKKELQNFFRSGVIAFKKVPFFQNPVAVFGKNVMMPAKSADIAKKMTCAEEGFHDRDCIYQVS